MSLVTFGIFDKMGLSGLHLQLGVLLRDFCSYTHNLNLLSITLRRDRVECVSSESVLAGSLHIKSVRRRSLLVQGNFMTFYLDSYLNYTPLIGKQITSVRLPTRNSLLRFILLIDRDDLQIQIQYSKACTTQYISK